MFISKPMRAVVRSDSRLSGPCISGGHRGHAEHGMSLIVVLMIVVIVSIVGLAATQIGIQGERAARNDRDRQIATQAAEAALLDAEFDIEGTAPTSTGKTNRSAVFSSAASGSFAAGCGTSGNAKGLCLNTAPGQKPSWMTVDLADSSGPSVEFGAFTGRSFPANTVGIQSAKKPRYIIESIPDYGASSDASNVIDHAYRITAIGFGPNVKTSVVLQTLYRR